MNTTAIITTVGVVLAAIFAFLGIVYAKRAENSAKLSDNLRLDQEASALRSAAREQEYLDDARFSSELAGALLDDYLGLSDCYGIVTEKWHMLINGLPTVCRSESGEMAAFMERIGDLPPKPQPRYRELQRERREALRRANQAT